MKIDANKMQILMGKKNFTIGQLSIQSNVSRATISYIKAGKNCTPITACKIAGALEVDVTEILQ